MGLLAILYQAKATFEAKKFLESKSWSKFNIIIENFPLSIGLQDYNFKSKNGKNANFVMIEQGTAK